MSERSRLEHELAAMRRQLTEMETNIMSQFTDLKDAWTRFLADVEAWRAAQLAAVNAPNPDVQSIIDAINQADADFRPAVAAAAQAVGAPAPAPAAVAPPPAADAPPV